MDKFGLVYGWDQSVYEWTSSIKDQAEERGRVPLDAQSSSKF